MVPPQKNHSKYKMLRGLALSLPESRISSADGEISSESFGHVLGSAVLRFQEFFGWLRPLAYVGRFNVYTHSKMHNKHWLPTGGRNHVNSERSSCRCECDKSERLFTFRPVISLQRCSGNTGDRVDAVAGDPSLSGSMALTAEMLCLHCCT